MENEQLDKIINLCDEVSKDVEQDATDYDGKPFDGRTVDEYFGKHGAAIKALSDSIKLIAQDLKSAVEVLAKPAGHGVMQLKKGSQEELTPRKLTQEEIAKYQLRGTDKYCLLDTSCDSIFLGSDTLGNCNEALKMMTVEHPRYKDMEIVMQ